MPRSSVYVSDSKRRRSNRNSKGRDRMGITLNRDLSTDVPLMQPIGSFGSTRQTNRARRLPLSPPQNGIALSGQAPGLVSVSRQRTRRRCISNTSRPHPTWMVKSFSFFMQVHSLMVQTEPRYRNSSNSGAGQRGLVSPSQGTPVG